MFCIDRSSFVFDLFDFAPDLWTRFPRSVRQLRDAINSDVMLIHVGYFSKGNEFCFFLPA